MQQTTNYDFNLIENSDKITESLTGLNENFTIIDNEMITFQKQITSKSKLSADLVDDTSTTNKFVTAGEKAKIPNAEQTTNKVTTLLSTSTDTEYPSAKAVYKRVSGLSSGLNALLDQIPVGTVEDTYINVQDSSDLPIKDIQVEGNAYQLQTTGKNLFDKDTATVYNWQINSTTHVIASPNQNEKSIVFECEPSTTYTISKVATNRLRVGEYATMPDVGDTLENYQASDSGTSITVTTLATSHYMVIALINIANNTTSIIDILNSLQIELGSSASTYESYSGGHAVPTPSYPQAIKVVTGNNTVYAIGKNLLSLGTQRNGYVDSTSLKFLEAPTKNALGYYFETAKLPDVITFSCIGGNSGNVCYFDEIPANNVICKFRDNGASSTRTVTIDKNYSYVHINLSYETLDVTNIQVEKGSTATTYEAPVTPQSQLLSLGNIELAKIGNYQDKLFKAVNGDKVYDSLDSTTKASLTYGSWYKQGNTRKYTSCVSATHTTNGIRFLLENISNLHDITSATNVITSFLATSFKDSNDNNVGGFSCRYVQGWGGMAIYTTDTDLINMIGSEKTASELKEWFNANVTMYVGINPDYDYISYTEITDTTLLEQLEGLYDLQTYRNITNIFTTTENEVPILNVTYRKDLQTLTDKIALLDARLSLLE